MEAVVDLGKVKTVNTVSMRFLQDHDKWIFGPTVLIIGSSGDGANFKIEQIKSFDPPTEVGEVQILKETIEMGGINTQYLQVKAGGLGFCPDWHEGKGEPALLFVDEIVIE